VDGRVRSNDYTPLGYFRTFGRHEPPVLRRPAGAPRWARMRTTAWTSRRSRRARGAGGRRPAGELPGLSSVGSMGRSRTSASRRGTRDSERDRLSAVRPP